MKVALLCIYLPLAAQSIRVGPQPGERMVQLTGVVVDASSGVPVDGASVELTAAMNFANPQPGELLNMRRFNGRSNEKGEFVIDAIAGDFSLRATHERWSLENPMSARVTLAADRPAEPVVIRMVRSATVSGVVEDRDGKPIPGITVELIDPDSAARTVGFRKESDAEGRFSFTAVPGGSYYLRGVEARFADRTRPRSETPSPQFSPTFYPSAGTAAAGAKISVYAGVDTPNLRLQMQSTKVFSVSGIVVGRETNPNPARAVRLVRIDDSQLSMPYSIAEAPIESPVREDGSFVIERVMPGRYRATIMTAIPLIVFPLGSQEIQLSDRDLNDIRLAVLPGGTLRGRVIFDTGVFEPGSWGTTVRGIHAGGDLQTPLQFAADGTFAIPGVPSGTYYVTSSGTQSFAVEKVTVGSRTTEGSKFNFVVPGSDEVVMAVSRTGSTISGSLEGLKNNEPINGVASAALLSGFSDGIPLVRTAPITPQGLFSFSKLEPGQYLVCAWTDQPAPVLSMLQSPNAPVQRLGQQCGRVTLRAGAAEQIQVRQTSLANVLR